MGLRTISCSRRRILYGFWESLLLSREVHWLKFILKAESRTLYFYPLSKRARSVTRVGVKLFLKSIASTNCLTYIWVGGVTSICIVDAIIKAYFKSFKFIFPWVFDALYPEFPDPCAPPPFWKNSPPPPSYVPPVFVMLPPVVCPIYENRMFDDYWKVLT